jgi:TonB family protein
MSGVLRYLLETGLCLALFYAGFWLFLRKETHFLLNRVYLLASLALSFLIPAFKIASPFRTYAFSSGPAVEVAPSLLALPSRASFGLTEFLFWAYIAGAAFFLVRFAAHLLKLYLVIRRNDCRSLGGMKVVSIDREFAPFSFLGYVFLNGPGSVPGNLGQVLAHERAHVRQKHSLDILLVEGATVLQWFNPIVRPYKRSIQETHEFLADGEVIAQGFDAARYRRTLLEQQVGARLLEFSHEFRQSQIKRRITMMSHARSKGAAKLKVLLLLPVAVLLVLALAEPRVTVTAEKGLTVGVQERSDSPQAEQSKKETLAKASYNLAILKAKQAELGKALETTTDPTERAKIEKSLQVLDGLRKSTEAYLKDPDHVPPPPPLPPKKTGPARVSENLAVVKTREAELRKALEATTDPAKRQEIENSLKVFGQLRESYEAYLKDPDHVPQPPPLPPPAPKGKAGLKMLMEKEADIKAQLAAEKDPAKVADLKAMLEKVKAKRQDLEAKLKEERSREADLKAEEAELRSQLAVEKDPDKIRVLEHDLQVVLTKEANPDAQVRLAAEIHRTPSSAEAKEMLLELEAKEAAARKQLAEANDQAEKAKLEETLKKIEIKRAELKAASMNRKGEMRPPKLVKYVEPVAPAGSNVKERVVLEVRIDTSGKVNDVKVLESVPGLDQAAIDAVKQWVYEPMMLDMKPVEAVITVTAAFNGSKPPKKID